MYLIVDYYKRFRYIRACHYYFITICYYCYNYYYCCHYCYYFNRYYHRYYFYLSVVNGNPAGSTRVRGAITIVILSAYCALLLID